MSSSIDAMLVTPDALRSPSLSSCSIKHLAGCVGTLADAKVLIVGDIMLDEYLTGDAERISPEAPVPVVLVEQEAFFVGGAGNVARNITSLGGTAELVGVTGADRAAQQVRDCLAAEKVQSRLIQDRNRQTTVKTRIMARQQQMLRIDREDGVALVPDTIDALLARVEEHIAHVGAVIISDYGKGVVCRRFMDGLSSLLHSRRLPVLVDPKPQNGRLYHGMTLLTPNAKETRALSGMPTGTPEEVMAAGKSLMKTLNCPCMITTLSADGMAVFLADGTVWHIGTLARRVFDVTGAGDTVIGVTALGMASGLSLLESCIIANFAAGLVVGEVGAATVQPASLIQAMEEHGDITLHQWA